MKTIKTIWQTAINNGYTQFYAFIDGIILGALVVGIAWLIFG